MVPTKSNLNLPSYKDKCKISLVTWRTNVSRSFDTARYRPSLSAETWKTKSCVRVIMKRGTSRYLAVNGCKQGDCINLLRTQSLYSIGDKWSRRVVKFSLQGGKNIIFSLEFVYAMLFDEKRGEKRRKKKRKKGCTLHKLYLTAPAGARLFAHAFARTLCISTGVAIQHATRSGVERSL